MIGLLSFPRGQRGVVQLPSAKAQHHLIVLIGLPLEEASAVQGLALTTMTADLSCAVPAT